MNASLTNSFRYDALVVGGGPAGLATAIELLRQGLTVVVLERTEYLSPRVGEHIPPETKAALVSLGLMDVLAPDRHSSCPGVRSVWGKELPEDRDYIFHPNGEGVNLSRPDFDFAFAALARQHGAIVFTDARVKGLWRTNGQWHVRVEHAGAMLEMRCSVVIDATGRVASIAKRLGATLIVYDELVGIFGTFPAVEPRSSLVLVEALAKGWWYSAGLTGNRVIATFMTDLELIETSRTERIKIWREQLAAAPLTLRRIDTISHTPDLHVRTARTQRLAEPTGDGWLAVGDAAMSFDPLSSEGISKGLECGKTAAMVVNALCRGDPSAFQAYREELDRVFAEYLVKRYRYYAAENRWPNEPFWRRRRLSPRPIGAGNSGLSQCVADYFRPSLTRGQ